MKTSLYNFLAGLIDYAGLFPPTSLDLETAVRNHAEYLAGNYGWMLGRFIIPATRLHQLTADPAFRYAVIVNPDVSEGERKQLRGFAGRVEMVETRCKETGCSLDEHLNQLLSLQKALELSGLQKVHLFIEAQVAEPAVSAIAAFNTNMNSSTKSSTTGDTVVFAAGFKLRCGGLTQNAIPTVEHVATIITACREKDIPVKFTAGIHQPLRHREHELGVMQHGFVNIFTAALLSRHTGIELQEIADCLSDQDPADFSFTEEELRWKDYSISAADIMALRRDNVMSFGSCSFIEPLVGLETLGFFNSQHTMGE